ncbi:alpha/beta fold hydrolase [Kitasatospora sp. NPDC089913]|uniref:alpha/beta fold hydrolase n=1 Tax=Streptomycetaceae TaxID=2062 RepID=UPI00087B3468|nr:alpha/beta fold hydrolase [Streptomyces sp. TLI_053]SDT63514.1 Lysophospholipase, alpha-beta hydrolase superfamily [Streptomyces sp. TLI_053]
MSTPPFLTLPPSARALRVATARGRFAALRAEPAGAVRGSALLVPGFTGSKEDFIALLEPLAAAGYRVTAVDQRGQYETGGPHDDPAAYTVAALGADVRALTGALAAEGGTGPLHLLGHSFGGQVVREAVLAAATGAAAPGGAPLPWASLTLMSTGPGPIDPAEAERTRLLVEVLPTMGLEEIWQVMQQMEEADGTRARRLPSPEVAAFLHRRWLANVPQALITTGGHLVAAPDRVAELAAAVTAGLPSLVLSGVQDYAWPVPEQTAMAERLGARRVVVADAGHSPNAEQPAATAEALLAHWG